MKRHGPWYERKHILPIFALKFQHVSFAAARLPFFEHFDFDLGVQKLVVSRELFVLIPEQLLFHNVSF